MDKIEVYQIMPYLPYKLKAMCEYNNKIGIINGVYAFDEYEDIKLSMDSMDSEHIWMFKPILKPLSYLIQDYSDGKTYLEYFCELCNLPFCENRYFSDDITRLEENGKYSIFDTNIRGYKYVSRISFDSKDLSFSTYHREESVNIPYKLYQLLFEHHFDVFGWIEKGLAVDFNSLNKK